jgi:hypothetical protein
LSVPVLACICALLLVLFFSWCLDSILDGVIWGKQCFKINDDFSSVLDADTFNLTKH